MECNFQSAIGGLWVGSKLNLSLHFMRSFWYTSSGENLAISDESQQISLTWMSWKCWIVVSIVELESIDAFAVFVKVIPEVHTSLLMIKLKKQLLHKVRSRFKYCSRLYLAGRRQHRSKTWRRSLWIRICGSYHLNMFYRLYLYLPRSHKPAYRTGTFQTCSH